MENTVRRVAIIPPDELTGLEVTSVSNAAAGVTGVTVAMQHIAKETGLWKGLKALSKLNQKDGIDCPGCAWPDPKHRSKIAEYCENGAKAIAEEATEKRCDIGFFAEHSVEEMSLWSDYKIGKSGRVSHPMYLPEGSSYYEPISWERAYDIIANELRACKPNEAVFYTSGRTSNEAAFLYQLFVRLYGTNNLPDCSNMCHESSGVGLSETIGIGKGTVTLEDIYEAEVVLVIGQNPGTNHPRMLSALQKCKANGGKVIHINPLPETGTTRFVDPQSPIDILKGGTKIADYFLQVKIGGDLALLKALIYLVVQEEKRHPGVVIDKDFIEKNTLGFESMMQQFESFDLDEASKLSGISVEQMRTVAEVLSANKKIISCWAMGITQHKYAVDTIQEIVNLHLLRGAVGIKGAGLCPVRGHSNVQGDRTMGIYEKPKPAFIDALRKNYSQDIPYEHGYDVVEAIEAMDRGDVKVFFAMGGNFISATPDSLRTGKAMQKCKLTVQVSTKLNRAHLVTGQHALILPCLGRTEKDLQQGIPQFVTVENSMGIVHSSQGNLEPASHHLKSEPAIVCELANRLFGKKYDLPWLDWKNNYDLIRNEIEATIPGFSRFNEQIRKPDGFYLPNGPRKQQFTTASGKAHFTVNTVRPLDVPNGYFIMMTIRSHDQYNTTIYGLDDRYRGIKNERRVVLMNRKDIAKMNFRDKELVNLISDIDGTTREALHFHVIPFDIPEGCVATYFPETNCLVPLSSVALKSNTPMSKFVPVKITKL
jgi:molybdopterin-dependent oxidoreductase alpha subunit